jgi:hypothetical protein
MYTMIAQIITAVLSLTVLAAEMYLWIRHGIPETTQMGLVYWTGLTGFSSVVAQFYDISGYLLSIFQLIYEILLVVLLLGVYKRYTPKNYMVLGVLTLFIPAARYVVIFVLRNRPSIDYDAYMRARREAYMRQQQQYHNRYGNPYNNPYNNPYGQNNSPYGNPYNSQNQNRTNGASGDPFEEFSSSKNQSDTQNGGNRSNTSNGGTGDGFFE